MPNKIGWCSDTINVFSGCEGNCTWCYARRMAHRLAHIPGTVYHDLASYGLSPFTPAWHADALGRAQEKAERWRKPRRIFVGSMGEIGSPRFFIRGFTSIRFNADIPLSYASPAEAWEVMTTDLFRWAPQHTYLLLTKRPDRLPTGFTYPPNVQVGVSVSGNVDAHRVGSLLARLHPTTYCWASVEPLLDATFDPSCLNGLDWVVVGAQTGPGARTSDAVVDAALRLCEHCRAVGIPVYVKENMIRLRPEYQWPQDIFTGGAP